MRNVIVVLMLCCSILVFNCNKGAAPTEVKQKSVTELGFARQISGGDLSGTWRPREVVPLEACLADPSQIAGMVDSLGLAAAVTGSVTFKSDKSFQWNTIISIIPTIKLGNTIMTMPAFADTLSESGAYQQPWEEAIVVPLHPKTFKIDTLGFTASSDTLMLVTLPAPFPGFGFVKYYLVFHFVK
ncbi:MAG: hypothetical protein ONB13_01425 [candidate division KSB1 bacterium]|nr:hypothetical protein [candidate division KSB1 bacterium]MDZ7336324.1 hypothetical protein [candidate division KSB1 bacterium]MDZ7358813.1 hypothetical protein [candidate division KSB1 bacterium]MDZ7375255.1 hypothetical protein [candidate division KSB1 bacterium]MDZ7402384.1 hypothetical protein [candidate division KSB1 bacterium]